MKEKSHWVMDYETIINLFVGVFQHYKDENQRKVFVIHESRNDFLEFVKFLNNCVSGQEWHISYNGLNFDAQITQFILLNQNRLLKLSTEQLLAELYNYAQKTIERSNSGQFSEFPPYKLKIKQIDLFKLNHWDSKAKISSLKWIQYSMDWDNVEEMPHHHSTLVESQEKLDSIVNYCINDVLSTKKIFTYSKEQISLRQTLTKEYNIDLYSASEPRISKEIFLYFLEKQTGISKQELKQLRTPRLEIVLKDCILPYVKFDTPEFQKVLDYFKNKTIKSTKDGFKYTLDYKDVKTDYGLGGIHGAAKAGVYKAAEGWIIMTSDVESYYPNLAIKNKFHPEHLPATEFCQLYGWFFDERKKIPKIDPKNYVYKIILNSTYGLSGDETSFLYDPKFTMQITVNGQLLLSMLYEKLTLAIPEAVSLMQNTDGLELMIPKDKIQVYLDVCDEWEAMTKLKLEHDQYSKMIIRDVNNYLAINTKGKVKCKGAFEWEDLDKKKVATFHKNKSFLVIPKAIYEYFVNGIKPEDYLAKNNNIFDYCGAVKAKGGWHFETKKIVHQIPDKYLCMSTKEQVEYLYANGWHVSWGSNNWVKNDWPAQEANNGIHTKDAFKIAIKKESVVQSTRLQKILRYYISNTGEYIIKSHHDGREIQVQAGGWKQTIINKINTTLSFESYDINKKYYLEEIYKQIEQIKNVQIRNNVQLKLF